MAPVVPIALSVDYADYVTLNVTAGVNNIPIPTAPASAKGKNRVVRINVEQFSNTRIELKQIELNAVSVLPVCWLGDNLIQYGYRVLLLNHITHRLCVSSLLEIPSPLAISTLVASTMRGTS